MIIKTVFACLCVSTLCMAGDTHLLDDEVGVSMHQFKRREPADPLAQRPGETHNQWLARVMFDNSDKSEAVARSKQREERRARDSHIRTHAGKYGK